MAVSQRFIDLLNMPVPALKKLIDDRGLILPPNASGKWAMAKAVASSLTREELEDATDGFLYAGRTSMSWFRLVPTEDLPADFEDHPELAYPLAGTSIDAEAARDALIEHAEADPFDENTHPEEIEGKPKLVVAREWQDGFLMTFAVARRVSHVIHNFELKEVLEDEFFAAYLRLADGTFEVRASAERADRLRDSWLVDFADTLGLTPISVSVTEADVRAFRDRISGRLAKYGGSDATGTSAIGTVTLGKSDTCDDLFEEQEFADRTTGYSPVSYDLHFDHNGTEGISVHISTIQGSVFLRTAVPEAVLGHVYSVLREAKAS